MLDWSIAPCPIRRLFEPIKRLLWSARWMWNSDAYFKLSVPGGPKRAEESRGPDRSATDERYETR